MPDTSVAAKALERLPSPNLDWIYRGVVSLGFLLAVAAIAKGYAGGPIEAAYRTSDWLGIHWNTPLASVLAWTNARKDVLKTIVDSFVGIVLLPYLFGKAHSHRRKLGVIRTPSTFLLATTLAAQLHGTTGLVLPLVATVVVAPVRVWLTTPRPAGAPDIDSVVLVHVDLALAASFIVAFPLLWSLSEPARGERE